MTHCWESGSRSVPGGELRALGAENAGPRDEAAMRDEDDEDAAASEPKPRIPVEPNGQQLRERAERRDAVRDAMKPVWAAICASLADYARKLR